MLSGRPTAVPDVSASFDLQAPPDLAAYGLQSAICVPMLEDEHLWGTLSVFGVKKHEWTANDQRFLATLGNQGVVAIRSAELFDNNKRDIWELKNLQEALQAATSTLDLNQVLQQVVAGAANASSAQIGCLALEESGKLVLKGGFGTDFTTAERLALGLGGDICRDVMSTATPVMQAMGHDSGGDSPLNPRAVLCVPITLRGKPQGVLFLAKALPGRPRVQRRPPQAGHGAGGPGGGRDRQRPALQRPGRGHHRLARGAGQRRRRPRPLHARPLRARDAVLPDDRAADEIRTQGSGRVVETRAGRAPARHRKARRDGRGSPEGGQAHRRRVQAHR